MNVPTTNRPSAAAPSYFDKQVERLEWKSALLQTWAQFPPRDPRYVRELEKRTNNLRQRIGRMA